MAIRLQKLCDPCMAKDIEREAVTVPIRLAGLEREMDLCEDHEKEYVAPLRELLFEHGRKTEGAVPVTAHNRKGGACFIPGCDETRVLQNLSTHMRTVHGMTLTDARKQYGDETPRAIPGSGDPCPFPGCTASPAGEHALGSHFKTQHGMTFSQWQIESGQVTEGVLTCDVAGCKAGPNDTPFKTLRPQGLAAHKKQAHGVAGTTKQAETMRQKTAARKATTAK